MTPPLIWFSGAVVPWEEARVHVTTEAVARGASVFEGIRSYWHAPTQRAYLLSLDAHLRRLQRSAKLLAYRMVHEPRELADAIAALLRELDYREHCYVRPTLFAQSARGGGVGAPDVELDAFVTAFPAPRDRTPFDGIRCCVSSWRRLSDLALTPRAKAGGGFLSLRAPRLEARRQGADEVILLGDDGTVAEASGASVFVVRDGVAITPPDTTGLLEGITRGHVEQILRDLGIPSTRRALGRTELYVADEVFLCSTLHEIQPVVEVDGYPVADGAPGPVTSACRDAYIARCEAGPDAPEGWLTPVT